MLPPRPARPTFRGLPGRAGRGFRSQLWSLCLALVEGIAYRALPWLAAQALGANDLRLELAPTGARRRGDVVVVAAWAGERWQLRPFLDFHRHLGVAEFVFLDLSESAALAGLLAGADDCAVWRPRRGPKAARVLYWTNYLRRVHASGRWCLSLDPCERFVFLHCETRHIGDLTQFLESEARDHMFAIVVDMYGEAPACEARLRQGQDPAELLDHFDVFAYGATEPGPYSSATVRGGPLRRAAHRDAPQDSPPLNRTPLVKWRWYYGYVTGRRLMLPRRLNPPHADWHTTPTACLLRYALVEEEAVLTQRSRFESVDIVADGRARRSEGLEVLRHVQLKHDFSVRYRRSSDLAEAGLLNPGQWF
jgi:hypothetical protein